MYEVKWPYSQSGYVGRGDAWEIFRVFANLNLEIIIKLRKMKSSPNQKNKITHKGVILTQLGLVLSPLSNVKYCTLAELTNSQVTTFGV